MSTDDHDPAADTAMFRAYVDREPESAAPPGRRWLFAGVAVVVTVLLAVLLA